MNHNYLIFLMSAAKIQNSPNVMPVHILEFLSILLQRKAHNFAVCSISWTEMK